MGIRKAFLDLLDSFGPTDDEWQKIVSIINEMKEERKHTTFRDSISIEESLETEYEPVPENIVNFMDRADTIAKRKKALHDAGIIGEVNKQAIAKLKAIKPAEEGINEFLNAPKREDKEEKEKLTNFFTHLINQGDPGDEQKSSNVIILDENDPDIQRLRARRKKKNDT